MRKRFPLQKPGTLYLTEGGQETEVMYRFGHELPEFAMFPLLDDPAALETLNGMYQRYLEVAAVTGTSVIIGGLDYRASPDWAAKIGYSAAALVDAQLRSIEFLREVSAPFRGRIHEIVIAGIIGPRGDAYSLNRTITAAEAEEYHQHQLRTLARAKVDVAIALTFNSVPEAVGVARAAAAVNLPLGLSFTLDSGTSRLKSGPSVREAIEATDLQCGEARPDFYGINCSHPFEFMPALEPGSWIERIRMLRPNASTKDKAELCQIGHLEDGDPPQLGTLMGELALKYPHIDIWGGCCGTWESHLGHIATKVQAARR